MSNNYASYYIPPSSNQYSNVICQIVGPLSTSQTPNQMEYHSYGILKGVHPNPPQFSPANTGAAFAQARSQYVNVDTSKRQQMLARERVVLSSTANQYVLPTQQQVPVNNSHMNYIAPPPSSMYTSIRARQAVGQSSLKQGLPVNAPLSYKSYDPNDARSALRGARSSGCVPPPKVGSIYNRTCTNGSTCNIVPITGRGY